MSNNDSRIGALTGLAFLILCIVGFTVAGEPPDPTEDSTQKIIDYYSSDEGKHFAGVILEGLAAASFVFFAGYLRRVLESERSWLPTVALAGAAILATGFAIDATITITLIETGDDIDPAAVQALSALWGNDFMPMAVGTLIFSLSTGLAIARHGGLPKWIGWILLALAAVSVTPIGFAGFIGTGLLVGVMSVILAMRAG